MTNLSYVWVTSKNNSLPSEESSYGTQNIVNTALKYPNYQINIYVDSIDDTIKYSLKPNTKMPPNIKFIPVRQLIDKCKQKIKESKQGDDDILEEKIKTIDNAYFCYLAELKYGKASYAGNFIKILGAYLQDEGFICDIGVQYNEETFSCLVNMESQYYSIVDPAAILWSGENSRNMVYNTINDLSSFYLEEGDELISDIEEMIKDDQIFSLERKKQILEDVERIRQKFTNKVEFFVNASTYFLDNVPERLFKLQDNIYSFALQGKVKTRLTLEMKDINHKLSHLGVHIDRVNKANDVNELNNNIEHAIRISRLREKPAVSTLTGRSTSQNKLKEYKVSTRSTSLEKQ